MTSRRAKSALQLWIIGGLVLGLVAGLAANYLTAKGQPGEAWRPWLQDAVRDVVRPIGLVFLRLLFMTVVPLVFSCLALAVYGMGNLRELGKIGGRTIAFTIFLSAISVGLGLLLVNTIRPGDLIGDEGRALYEREKAEAPDTLKQEIHQTRKMTLSALVTMLIPRNPVESAARAFDGEMLAFLVFALLFGIALRSSRSQRAPEVAAVLEGIYDVSIWLINFALWLAPLGVAALVFSMSSVMGLDILKTLAGYVLTVLLGLALQLLVVYPMVLKIGCGVSPLLFFSRIREAMGTAFSTSSSNATLPTTLEVARTRLGVSPRVANFVLTLGSTLNQNGTALFEGVTILFLAQFFGKSLSIDQQALVVVLSVLAGIGTAGVPSGSIPLLVPILVSLGIEEEAILLILGVDRFLDMCRTVLNVTGDLVVAAYIAKREGELNIPPE